MTQLDFDNDQFLKLVTDALRAGPGSDVWKQAISELMVRDFEGEGGELGMDEYRLLFTARNHLESGKGYRRIHAGPKFTQKVMQAVALEADGSARGSGKLLSMTNLIAAGTAMLVLGAVVVITWMVWGGGAHQSLTDLQAQTFSADVLSTNFDGAKPAGWKTIGTWPLSFDGSMHPTNAYDDDDFRGCGLVTSSALAAQDPTAIEAKLKLPASGDTVVQVFVSDQPDFNEFRATSSHELVWLIQPAGSENAGKSQVVLPDGTFATTVAAAAGGHGEMTVRLAFNSDYVVVQNDGRQIYAGPHQLSPIKPRYVGVRFLCGKGEQPAVLSVRVSKG